MTKPRGVRYRTRPTPADVPALRRLVAATGVFYAEERAIALELLEDAAARRSAERLLRSFFAERCGELIGYAAWGRVPLTRRSFDLYWIVVAPTAQGQGVGRRCCGSSSAPLRSGAAATSISKPRHERPTTGRGASIAAPAMPQVARLRDFYAPGDHKVMFCKVIRGRR